MPVCRSTAFLLMGAGFWLVRPPAAAAQGVAVGLSQRYAQLTAGQTLALNATVSGSANTAVVWQVDNIIGGNAELGTVSASGSFTAPTSWHGPASATVTAVSAADPSAKATATITLLAQVPAGRSFYVAPSGSDANRGTFASPFRTIQHAASLAASGDTVLVRGGVYNELVALPRAGTAQAIITLTAYPGETPVIDGTGLAIPGGQSGLITLTDASYVVVQGFELRNYTTASTKSVPIGIFVTGSGSDVQLINNHVHDISTTAATTPSACASNALGIAVYGSAAPASIGNLVVSGNELDHLTTGCSESMSLDGNVDGFLVTANSVHDNDNIGIDAIGFERVSPDPAYDQARGGIIRGNTVFNISSYGNPDYGKQYASDGIYVDGGTNIVIEQNLVHDVDLGIELASEHKGRLTSYVVARNNVIYADYGVGVTIGGYGAARGGTDHCTLVGNSLYGDDTRQPGDGELQIQFNATNNLVENNIVFAGPPALLLHGFTKNAGAPALLDHNLYFSAKGALTSKWQWNGHVYAGFANYQAGSGQDAHSLFADPAFIKPGTPAGQDLRPGSPAFGAGVDLGAAVIGSADFAGNPRVGNGAVTLGAYEQ